MRRLIAILALFAALCLSGWSTVYYVDFTTGLDTDSGLTEALAWKTIAKVNASSFSAGDSVLFKRGEVWREQLTVPTSGSAGLPITFGAYGTGDDPVITGANLITPGTSWSAYTTGTSTWSAALNSNADFGTYNIRTIIPAGSITTSGTQVRIKIKAHNTTACTISHCSIGPRSGTTSTFASAPVVITWDSGSLTKDLTAGQEYYSDWMTYTLDEAVSQLIHTYCASKHQICAYFSSAVYISNTGDLTESLVLTDAADFSFSPFTELIEVRPINVWTATLTSTPSYVSFNSDKGFAQASIGACDSAKDWYWAANVLYAYSVTDPDTAYTVPGIQANVRNYCIRGDAKDYITVEDIQTGGSIYGGINFHDSTGIICNRTTANLDGYGIHVNGTTTLTANDCVAHHSFVNNFYVCETATGTFNNCASYNADNDGFSTGNTGNMNCNYCLSYSNGVEGLGITGPGDGYTSHGDGYLKLHYCIAHSNIKAGCTPTQETYGEVFNCTFYNNWDGVGVGWTGNMAFGIDTTAAVTWTLRNNVFSGHEDEILVTAQAVAGGLILDSDYNCIYDWRKATYADKAFTWNDIKYNWADWKTQSGGDANSLNTDPLLTDPASGDFTLQPTSPCINAGIDVGLTEDYAGRRVPQGSAPDIGAYEYPRLKEGIIKMVKKRVIIRVIK